MIGDRTSRVASVAAFPVLLLVLAASLILFRDQLLTIFSSPERLKLWVDQWGVIAPLAFVCLQILQVVVFLIPGEVPQIAGGYLFGVFSGFLLSILGITIGSAFNFYVARLLGVPFVRRVLGGKRYMKFDRFISSPESILVFFILFLIPGIPKDILCYIAGLSPIGFGPFLVLSAAGRVPGILGSVIIGSAAAEQRWLLLIFVFSGALVFTGIGLIYRDRLLNLIERHSGRKYIHEEAKKPDPVPEEDS